MLGALLTPSNKKGGVIFLSKVVEVKSLIIVPEDNVM